MTSAVLREGSLNSKDEDVTDLLILVDGPEDATVHDVSQLHHVTTRAPCKLSVKLRAGCTACSLCNVDDRAAVPSNDEEETHIIELFESFKARADSLEERQKELMTKHCEP